MQNFIEVTHVVGLFDMTEYIKTTINTAYIKTIRPYEPKTGDDTHCIICIHGVSGGYELRIKEAYSEVLKSIEQNNK